MADKTTISSNLFKSKGQQWLLNETSHGPYYNQHQVELNFSNYLSAIRGNNTTVNKFIEETENRVRRLIKTLEKQEKNFQDKYGDIEELSKKIEEWNNSGADQLLTMSLALKVTNSLYIDIELKEIGEKLENYLNSSKFNSVINDDTDLSNFLPDLLNLLASEKKLSVGNRGHDKRYKEVFSIEYDKKGYKVKINEGKDNEFSQSLRQKIYSTLKEKEDEFKSYKVSEKEVRKNIYNIIIANASISNARVKEAIRHELLERNYSKQPNFFKAYAVYANDMSIKGWLGEVYWNAFFNYISKGSVRTIPIGDVKNLQGKSMSVDMLIKNYGFQIKSWSIKDNSYATTKSINLGNFLNKIGILESEIGIFIARAFGSLSYNKPLQSTEVTTKGGKSVFKQAVSQKSLDEYTQMYLKNEFAIKKTFPQLENLFSRYSDKILGLQDTADEKDINSFLKNQTFLNTFWLINDKIIPSSLILTDFLENLKLLKISEEKPFKLISLTENETKTVWPQNTNISDQSMANRWKLQYQLTFDFNRLLARAAQKAKQR